MTDIPERARVAGLTPSQTVGPFFLAALLRADAQRTVLAGAATAGERIRIAGRVLDGDGQGVPDALIEIWQADAAGRHYQNQPGTDGAGPAPADDVFVGFGRCATDEDGGFAFATVKPGRVPATDSAGASRMQAPHICVAVFARGLLNHLLTRLYFADEVAANAGDPVLARVPAERRPTLLARREQRGEDVTYHFDVRLQGAGETVFFNI